MSRVRNEFESRERVCLMKWTKMWYRQRSARSTTTRRNRYQIRTLPVAINLIQVDRGQLLGYDLAFQLFKLTRGFPKSKKEKDQIPHFLHGSVNCLLHRFSARPFNLVKRWPQYRGLVFKLVVSFMVLMQPPRVPGIQLAPSQLRFYVSIVLKKIMDFPYCIALAPLANFRVVRCLRSMRLRITYRGDRS